MAKIENADALSTVVVSTDNVTGDNAGRTQIFSSTAFGTEMLMVRESSGDIYNISKAYLIDNVTAGDSHVDEGTLANCTDEGFDIATIYEDPGGGAADLSNMTIHEFQQQTNQVVTCEYYWPILIRGGLSVGPLGSANFGKVYIGGGTTLPDQNVVIELIDTRGNLWSNSKNVLPNRPGKVQAWDLDIGTFFPSGFTGFNMDQYMHINVKATFVTASTTTRASVLFGSCVSVHLQNQIG